MPKPCSEIEKGMAAPPSAMALILRAAPARRAASVGASKLTLTRQPAGRQVRKRRLHRRLLVDLEGDPRIERQPERQDQRAGDAAAARRIQFDPEHALAVLLGLLLHEDAALDIVGDLTGDTPVLIGFLKGRCPSGEGRGLLGLNGEGGQGGDGERREKPELHVFRT